MSWFSRRKPSKKTPLVLHAPRLGQTQSLLTVRHNDGFAAATVGQLGLATAFSPRAHEITDLICAHLLPEVKISASQTDLPHTIDLLRSAAQTGAGIGLVEARNHDLEPDQLTRTAVAAMAQALADLGALGPELGEQARFLMLAGHYLARRGEPALAELVEQLRNLA